MGARRVTANCFENQMNIKLFFVLSAFSMASYAQPRILLEACNRIENSAQRLECLDELMKNRGSDSKEIDSSEAAAIKRAKSVFAGLESSIQIGTSLDNYARLILEPNKELGVLKSEAPGLSQKALEKLREALDAYTDAAIIWRKSIYESQDGGIFVGKILNPEMTGLMYLVNKYNLPTTSVLLNTHLPADVAIRQIWWYAKQRTQEAFDIIDGKVEAVLDEKPESTELTVNRRVVNKEGCKDKYSAHYDPKKCEPL